MTGLYSCASRFHAVPDLTISITGDESYHAACFTCRSCSRKIEELVFAKTSQGIYCMTCHNERVARSRRHAEAKKKKQAKQKKEEEEKKEVPTMDSVVGTFDRLCQMHLTPARRLNHRHPRHSLLPLRRLIPRWVPRGYKMPTRSTNTLPNGYPRPKSITMAHYLALQHFLLTSPPARSCRPSENLPNLHHSLLLRHP